MAIIVNYVCQGGGRESITFERAETAVRLAGMGITSIDLAPLSSCNNMRRLELQENNLESLDLSPLSACASLEVLYMWGNPLGNIDLTPLRTCSNLKELGLSNSKLRAIDFTPLSGLSNLLTIGLWRNQIREVDFNPLSTCSELRGIWVSQNPIESMDLTPLIPCSKLTKIGIPAHYESESVLSRETLGLLSQAVMKATVRCDAPLSASALRSMKHVVSMFDKPETEWMAYAVVHNLLSLLGFKWAGILERPVELTRKLTLSKDELMKRIIIAVCRQVDKGGPTIGLDVNMMTEEGRLAKRVPTVLELRKTEMQDVAFSRTDLRPLWLTAYGYNLLTIMNLGLKCDSGELSAVVGSLKQAGVEVRASKRRRTCPDTVPSPMAEYICKLIAYRHKVEGRRSPKRLQSVVPLYLWRPHY